MPCRKIIIVISAIWTAMVNYDVFGEILTKYVGSPEDSTDCVFLLLVLLMIIIIIELDHHH